MTPRKFEEAVTTIPLRTGVLLVAGGMLLGRMSGLVREVAIADRFGMTRGADLAIFAMVLPDLLTNLFVGGAVAAVLIPQYHALARAHGDAEARTLIGRTLLVLTLVSLAITVVLYLLAPCWVPVLAPGFVGVDRATATMLSRIALLAFPLSAATAVVTAALQIAGRLGAAAAGTLVMNGVIIGVLLFAQPLGIELAIAAWAVVAGALGRLLVGILCARRGGGLRGIFGRPSSPLLDWSLAARYVQALAGIGFVVCFPVVARAVGTTNAGESAAINYAIKLVEVPAGLFSAIIGFAVLPRLSRLVQNQQHRESVDLLGRTAVLMMAAIIPLSLGYYLLADHLVGMLFEHGQLTPSAAATVSRLSRILIWGAPATVLAALCTAYFHARKDTRTPLWTSGAMLLVLIVSSMSANLRFGATGIAAALLGVNILLATVLATRCWWTATRMESESPPVLPLESASTAAGPTVARPTADRHRPARAIAG